MICLTFAVCDNISDVFESMSAVSWSVSDISWVDAWARFFSDRAFFSVAAVWSRVLENFSAVSFSVATKLEMALIKGAHSLIKMKRQYNRTALTLLSIPRQCRAGRGLQSVEGETAVEVVERPCNFFLLAQDHLLRNNELVWLLLVMD